jgi:hypothetical protein
MQNRNPARSQELPDFSVSLIPAAATFETNE